jgi:hypothetical protein
VSCGCSLRGGVEAPVTRGLRTCADFRNILALADASTKTREETTEYIPGRAFLEQRQVEIEATLERAQRIQRDSVIVFDEYWNYPDWKQHEFEAFEELKMDLRRSKTDRSLSSSSLEHAVSLEHERRLGTKP